MKQSHNPKNKFVKGLAPALVLTQLAVAAMSLAPTIASAHGTVVNPPSRAYICSTAMGENPESPSDPACRAAKETSGTDIFYTWQGNSQGGAGGNHTAVVPNGLLCSGGSEGRKGLDLLSPWKATVVSPDANGKLTLTYNQTAQHATEYFKFYISKDSYDYSRTLRWDDLQEIGGVGKGPGIPGESTMDVTVPTGMTGKHILYYVWQRSDSQEAFYGCSDIDIAGGAPSSWKPIGPVRGGSAVMGHDITLRVFDKTRGSDVEKHTITVAADQTPAAQWIYALAQKVNGQSQRVKIGKLGKDGKIEPVLNGTENDIFGNGKLYNFEIDHATGGDNGGGDNGGGNPPANKPPVAVATGPATAEAGQQVTLSAAGSSDPDGDPLTFKWDVPPGIVATPNGASLSFTAPELAKDKTFAFKVIVNDGKTSASASHSVKVKAKTGGGDGDGGNHPAYKEGTIYKGGDLVINDGKIFECKPGASAGWCGQSAMYYEPGKGLAWTEAWAAK
ncbi:lytic polysaccharide monooxygenase [Paraherbaspirillum soli]|uniref:Lytic polysaccharide monooxygenase n=1 Tax=Paraherbaspirillum soli TaxID=631222 RepID=A0ABW0MC50_9BURK